MNLLSNVETAFRAQFRGVPLLVQSPGRINLIGEHTDYNDGFVLPAAIDRSVTAAIADNHTETVCRVYAADRDSFLEFDVQFDLRYPTGSWENYIIGVVRELMQAGHGMGGFDMAFAGDIPVGAGLSSSAALENSLVFGLNELFDLGLKRPEMALISQRAEHHYAGVQCGIMDQFASLMGREGQAIFLDCRSLKPVYLPLNLSGYELLLINSHANHELGSSEYNLRREECETGMEILREAYPEAKALRDISLQKLESMRDQMPPLIYDRCHYVIRENMRVVHSVLALEQGDLAKFGKILYSAHTDMRDLYAITCAEVDYLVEAARLVPSVAGARMMGGGFGGCVLHLVEAGSAMECFSEELQDRYHQRFGRALEAYTVHISDGVQVVEAGM